MAETFTASQKAMCAKREADKRESFYPRWVAAGKMSQKTADREIALMRAIQADYERQEQGDLFGQEAGVR